MRALQKFKVNSPKVAHEIIEGEVVIINLERGHYYSLVKAGTDIWGGIERGSSKEEIIEEIIRRYEGDRHHIETAISDLIDKLQHEELIVLDDLDESSSQDIPASSLPNAEIKKLTFEPPTLAKYTDMEDLLLLDPIHEVDEMGWPNAKQVTV